MICMFSRLVKTFPHDFPFFVGSLLGGIGVRKNLDRLLIGCFGAGMEHESISTSDSEEENEEQDLYVPKYNHIEH